MYEAIIIRLVHHTSICRAAVISLLLIAAPSYSQPYAVDPQPELVVDDLIVGASPTHRLGISVAAGELETFFAQVEYPQGFGFLGFDRIGAENSVVGIYDLDLNFDGLADVSYAIRSRGPFDAYVDVIEDGAFSVSWEPSVSISRSALLSVSFPAGGDALASTVTVPSDARATIMLSAGVLANPGTEGHYEVRAQLTSVDPGTGGPTDDQAPHPVTVEFLLSLDIMADLIFRTSFEVESKSRLSVEADPSLWVPPP